MQQSSRITRSARLLCAVLALGLAGCIAPPKKKTYVEVERQPEMMPGAQPGDQSLPGHPGGTAAGPPPAYLPPSERGARVEVTEVPEGSPPPAPAAPATDRPEIANAPGAPAAAGAKRAGDAGGNMPTTAGAPSYQPPPGAPRFDAPANAALGTVQPLEPALPASALPPVEFRPEPGGDAARQERLDAQKREFDAAMRRAQAAAADERAGRAGPEAADIDRGGAPGHSTGTGNMPGEAHDAARTEDPRALPTGERPRAPQKGEAETIVARQLREAAERETDPVLREKLWAEYRRYARGAGAAP